MNRPLSRYECKYLVLEAWVPEIRRIIGPFVRPDRFAPQAGGMYRISSLYLDSPDLQLLRMAREGWSERMKLRARTYSERQEDPVFLEVKRRFNGVVHKTRARLARAEVRAPLRSHAWGAPARSGPSELRQFVHLAQHFAVRPVRHVRYLREAYESRGGEPVRVTFDRALEQAEGRDGELSPDGSRWRPLGLEGVVLELKFTGGFPLWMGALVARFELERRSISKYSLAMESAPCAVPAIPGGTPGRTPESPTTPCRT
jgi:hypothetical protein